MSRESRRPAAALLILPPTVFLGGLSILNAAVERPAVDAEHTPAGLVAGGPRTRGGAAHPGLRVVAIRGRSRAVDRLAQGGPAFGPIAAILLPLAYFLSVLTPDATEPNGFIYLAYVGAFVLAAGLIVLGVGLLRTG